MEVITNHFFLPVRCSSWVEVRPLFETAVLIDNSDKVTLITTKDAPNLLFSYNIALLDE